MIRTVICVVLCCAVLALTGAAQTVPPGLAWLIDQWKSDVVTGDNAALQSLYSSNPPAAVVSADGKQQFPIATELDFWTQARAGGMEQPAVNILGATEQNGVTLVKLEYSFRAKTPAGKRERYVVEQQAWQRQPQGWRMVASSHTPVLKMRPVGKLNPHLYEPNANAKAEIHEALLKAARTHKRVLVVFGGNWCYDCHVLDAAMRQADVSPLLSRNYVLVHVDIGRMDKNLDLAQKYHVPLEKGVPALAVVAPDGRLLYSQQHGEFESARSMDPDDLIAFLKKWEPPAR